MVVAGDVRSGLFILLASTESGVGSDEARLAKKLKNVETGWAIVREMVQRFLMTVRRPLTTFSNPQDTSSSITFDCNSSLDSLILASS